MSIYSTRVKIEIPWTVDLIGAAKQLKSPQMVIDSYKWANLLSCQLLRDVMILFRKGRISNAKVAGWTSGNHLFPRHSEILSLMSPFV